MGTILGILLLRQPLPPAIKSSVPLPSVMHRVISATEIGDRQVVIIGDVHGCFDEMMELLTVNDITPDNTAIVFCGDIVNKGPKNLETLRYVKNLNAYVVRGNHEEHVISRWLNMKETCSTNNLSAKYHWIQDLSNEEMDYLMELPYTLSIPHLNAVVVHAGLYPWRQLHHQQPQDMILMRNMIDGDGQSPRTSKHIEQGLPWSSYWSGPEHVYFGHDARRKLQRRHLATGLDTGCLYGGCLTAVMIHPVRKFLTVKAKETYRNPNK